MYTHSNTTHTYIHINTHTARTYIHMNTTHSTQNTERGTQHTKHTACMYTHMCIQANITHTQHIRTWDFSSAVLLIALMMAALFCWHVQHKSVQGFEVIIFGKRLHQYVQNVGYCTARRIASIGDFWYIVLECRLSYASSNPKNKTKGYFTYYKSIVHVVCSWSLPFYRFMLSMDNIIVYSSARHN